VDECIVVLLSFYSFLPLRNLIFIHFPKREELLLRTVLAFPNASKMGLAERILLEIESESGIVAERGLE
jgi:hypothetical protein